jgi:hypothetical protein
MKSANQLANQLVLSLKEVMGEMRVGIAHWWIRINSNSARTDSCTFGSCTGEVANVVAGDDFEHLDSPRLFGFRSLAELFVKLVNSLTKRESRLRRFARGQIADSCLSAPTGGGNLWLCNAEGLKFGNDFFEAHTETITVIRYYVKRFFDTRF